MKKDYSNISIEETASWYSKLFFLWTRRLIDFGETTNFTETNLF